ncbi:MULTISPECIES: hypothetical protein [Methylorubrum]|jgi:hypothetical protein|uniref:Uncharacterized protein n=1 Tax=Methylorubrum extorquens (strain ATCC 14718 / DSM 1338 / JCM 2805 / NCIMB 9133 / AM1) TaxID=272630 RepID=C5B0M4_METEA|nr:MULTISPECIES: hypothetical protein [Methylorubrum]KQP93971.1 hypothetical protein ASF55_18760 [Methylobacterium sp. Leaf119]ACS41611.1 hypothetical protein; putative exported protein [Methylorubrum extorquens AM1]MCP1545378.1 hypothetical protein [Methylorubrum extorquens]MCP1587275.1 hypothetical protein [Methylorubrum extorquens]WIU38659.1 hypothetical protein KQ926_18945 [Methylorubrum extorquens]
MIKHTGIAILLSLSGFALGSVIARVTEQAGAPAAGTTAAPPALRHISQLPPPPAAGKPAARSGR